MRHYFMINHNDSIVKISVTLKNEKAAIPTDS